MKPVEKCIHVTDNIIITDLTVVDPRKNFYFLLADIPDEENSVILKFSLGLDEENPQDRARNHVANIVGIPGKEYILCNIRLVNYTAQEAEERGLLHPPGIIEHIPNS